MGFEYDEDKSAANKRKHGIDFAHAKALWDDPDAIILPALTDKEMRYLVIGMIGRKHWAAIVTDRDENIRLISVRRARIKEVELYEKNKSIDA
jgi:uncharacterized DUF497 family protein